MSKDDLIINLKKPIVGHEVIRQIKLREPVANDILPVGFPYSWQPTAEGGFLFIENNEVIKYYCERLIVEPGDQIALFANMGIEDTLELRQRVLGFFLSAGKKSATSENSSTASSSTSNGAPQTSAA